MNEHFSILWGTRQIKNQQLLLYLACAVKQLKGMGIKAFDCVAVCDESSVEYVILLLALWQLKVLAAPISPRWPDKTIASYVSRINARQLFNTADIKRIVCFDARHNLEIGTYKELDPEQDVTVIATSGSSGEAKAAVHSWGNHFYSAQGSAETIPLTHTDRWLLSLPLYHVSGLGIIVRCLLSGAGLVIPTDPDPITDIARGKITHVSLVASQLMRLLAVEKNHAVLRSLKCILLGGGAIPRTLIDKSVKLGLNIYLSYGLTEMTSQVATGKVTGVDQPCARVLPYRQLCITPDGEILVKGEVLFKGYITGARLNLPTKMFVPHHDHNRNSSSSAGPLGTDFWFFTGDMGRLDKQGHLTVMGRRDNMFISGGENIYPEEIEKVLLSIVGIQEAVVVPKEDKEFGQRPIAFIKYQGAPLEEDHLVRYLMAELPRFKVPVAFLSWPQDLMSQGLKISRQEFLKTLPRR
jgi:O-succinylbenzoic acid--CoA ligase